MIFIDLIQLLLIVGVNKSNKHLCFLLHLDGYTTDDMDLRWKQKDKPVSYNEKLQLPEFTFQAAITHECTANFSTGMECDYWSQGNGGVSFYLRFKAI